MQRATERQKTLASFFTSLRLVAYHNIQQVRLPIQKKEEEREEEEEEEEDTMCHLLNHSPLVNFPQSGVSLQTAPSSSGDPRVRS